MSEIELHRPTDTLAPAEQWQYAETVASASMLPQQYRNKPADIMIAVGLGQAMGLSPAESLYRIDVIQGKPTASAELIAANVRKAGHKLRVRGDETSATATIVRADDPDFEFTVTRDMAWAQRMGLSSRDQYKKQAGTMLQYRAITAVARLACPEALYGVAYTPDEIGDMPQQARPAGGGLAAALAQEPETPTVEPETAPEPDGITSAQQKKMGALMREAGITQRDLALAFVADVIGRDVGSRNELTKAEAGRVIDALEADAMQKPADEPVDAEIVPDSDSSDSWAGEQA